MVVLAILPLSLLFLPTLVDALDCSLSAFRDMLPSQATVTFVRRVEDAGTFEVPADDVAYTTSPTGLRALCAVEIQVTSSSSSAYKFGLFLPDQWNSRFLAVGNGGFGGGINWLDMGAGVTYYGFAVMSTDTGHNSTTADATWALAQPQKQIDWGYRAMHGAVELGKQIVHAYFSSNVTYSYYSGCSTGGRQGLAEAERFPDDFDGLLVGSPAWWTTHLQPWSVKVGLYNYPNTSPGHIPQELFPVIAAAVQKQCDPQDGLVDAIISNPDGCNVCLEELLCDGHVTDQVESTCLTAAQVDTLRKIYSEYFGINHEFLGPNMQYGSEDQWSVLLGGDKPNSLGTGYVENFLLNDPHWDFTTYNDSIVDLADRLDPGGTAASNFDLSPLQQSGGKILHYHGLADGLIPSGYSEYFYNNVNATLRKQGIELDPWYRLFLVPGMQHCAGTASTVNAPWYFAGANQAGILGANISGVPGFRDAQHDGLLALMQWKENGIAPDQIVATKYADETAVDERGGEVLRQRPLCPYPKHATYNGVGDANDAESWTCVSS